MAKRKIFLSYSRENKAKVRSLYARLSDAGFEPWMDVKKNLPGQIWPVIIKQAIEGSDFFLACLTKSSVDSEGYFKRELELAMAEVERREGIYLIPFKLEDCELPESLQNFEWVALYERGGWDRLLKSLQAPNPTHVTLIEFELIGLLEYFNEEEFIAALRNVVGADVQRIRITGIRPGSVKVTVESSVEGDDKELTRILASLRDSKELQRKFSVRTRLSSVSYIQKGQRHTFRTWQHLLKVPLGLGMVAGFVAGLLGSLLADLIRQGGFGNPFTLPRVLVVIFMTLTGFGAGIWAALRPSSLPGLSRFRPGHPRLALVLAFILLAVPAAALLSTALDKALIRIRGCGKVEVEALELELPAGRQKFFEREITLRRLDLYNRQNLAGRVVLLNLADGEGCACEWWVKTDLLPRQQLSPPNEAKDCIFSIPLQEGVTEINLTLNVGRRAGASGFERDKYFRFKINVQQ